MRVAARAFLIALLLVLFGVSLAVTPGVDSRDAGQHPPMYDHSHADDLQDWLRLSEGALPASATAPPETWWAVCPSATGGSTPRGWLLIGEVSSLGLAAASPAPRSSRAPPFA